jgi:predicted PurR-regulated permease PerM
MHLLVLLLLATTLNVATADVEEAMPLPTDPKVIYLGGLFLLGLAAALYAAAEIVWPLVFAFMLSLLFKPVQRVLARLQVPRLVSALLVVLAVLGLVVGLGTAVSGPATTWAAKLPDGIPRLVERLRFLEGPLGTLQNFWHQIQSFAGWREDASSSVGTSFLGHFGRRFRQMHFLHCSPFCTPSSVAHMDCHATRSGCV